MILLDIFKTIIFVAGIIACIVLGYFLVIAVLITLLSLFIFTIIREHRNNKSGN